MDGMNHQALIGLEVAVLRGIDVLKKSVENITGFCDVLAISSIIRSSKIKGVQNPDPHMYVVLKIISDLEPKLLISNLIKIEDVFLKEYFYNNFKAVLLTYANDVNLSPNYLLPHPKLVYNKAFLIGAVEIWNQYQHPILNKPIQTLLDENDIKDVEFVAQGKILITSQKNNLQLV